MKTLCFIILVGISFHISAQERDPYAFDQLVEGLFALQDGDLNYEEIYEDMMQLLSNPINLNKASPEDLRVLPILSDREIEAILRYRQLAGDYISVYELQSVPELDVIIVRKILPFVTVGPASTASFRNIIQRILNEQNNYLLVRYEHTLESKKGFSNETEDDARYQGNRGKTYLRFRTSASNDFSVGFTAEQDPGERFTWNSSARQYGFDFLSAHVQTKHKGRLKNIIVGDFQSQFGQGLILGGGFGAGKGSETILAVRRSNIGFTPFTSATESAFLRGIAATWTPLTNVTASAFYSSARRDASVDGDSLQAISSFQLSGFHRNKKELAVRKQSREKNMGMIISYRKKSLEAGFILHHIAFSDSVSKRRTLYNQFEFRGRSNTNVGIFANGTLYNFTFFGEAAKTAGGGTGVVAGLIGSLSSAFDISVVYRNYQKDFAALNGNAFSENTRPQNERGIYWGWKYLFSRKFMMTGYADLFSFPWLRYRSYVLSSGHEWLAKLSYTPSRQTAVFVQIREENKVRNLSDHTSPFYVTAPGAKRNYCISIDYGIGQRLKLRTRALFSTFTLGGVNTQGIAIMQDIHFELKKFDFTARYALFDTDDFDNRQYAYENDVWLAYSFPAYQGTGVRRYAVLGYSFTRKLSIWLRYANIKYNNLETIGSGLEMIAGNSKNDLKFQMKIKF